MFLIFREIWFPYVNWIMNMKIKIHKGFTKLFYNSKEIISSPKVNVVCILQAEPLVETLLVSARSSDDKSLIWHKRLGHVSEKGMIILNKLGCFGKDNIKSLKFCEDCVIGKQNKLPFKIGIHKSTSILNYLHAHLWGLASVSTLSGFRFYLLIVYDFSRKNGHFF